MRGITRIPLTQTARIAITNAVGSTVAEAAAKPVTHLAFEFVGPASKVVALTVGTAEFFRSLDPTSQNVAPASRDGYRGGAECGLCRGVDGRRPDRGEQCGRALRVGVRRQPAVSDADWWIR